MTDVLVPSSPFIVHGRKSKKNTNNDEQLTNNLLQLAASAESGSEHPLAKAVVSKAQEEKMMLHSVSDFKNIAGGGISATVEKQKVLIGTEKLLQEKKVLLKNIDHDMIRTLEESGKTVVHVAINSTYAGSIAIADTIKDDSREAIAALTKLGFDVFMITGDNERTAKAIAQQVGISSSNVFAHVLPQDKSEIVRKLQNGESGNMNQESGKKKNIHNSSFIIHNSQKQPQAVAFVGDGINDAPALTQADVGIAMGTGTDIAIESGDIVLVRGNLSVIVSAIKLSNAAFAKIKQNLFWAFAYNILAIPLAFLGLLHPVIAEAAMASSSITVVTNANLLRKTKV